MVTFELVHEGIEGITQAEKVHSKEIGWHVHRHEKKIMVCVLIQI